MRWPLGVVLLAILAAGCLQVAPDATHAPDPAAGDYPAGFFLDDRTVPPGMWLAPMDNGTRDYGLPGASYSLLFGMNRTYGPFQQDVVSRQDGADVTEPVFAAFYKDPAEADRATSQLQAILGTGPCGYENGAPSYSWGISLLRTAHVVAIVQESRLAKAMTPQVVAALQAKAGYALVQSGCSTL